MADVLTIFIDTASPCRGDAAGRGRVEPTAGRTVAALVVATLLSASAPARAAPDGDAARALARQNKCFECHAIDKKSDGPSWKEVAAKYRGKTEAPARLMTHLTTGETAKFADGHEEPHKIVKAPEKAQIVNLIDWILSL